MEKENTTHTLEEVTYSYLVKKMHDTNYKNISFEAIKSENECSNSYINEAIRADFANKTKTFSDNLLKIEDYLGIKDIIAKCKNQKFGYTFTYEDVAFLEELMYKFTLKQTDIKGKGLTDTQEDLVRVWSDIRKVINKWDKEKYIKNQDRNDFVDIYRNNSGKVVYSEINFIIEGFLKYIRGQNVNDTNLYEECETQLNQNTSIVKIKWLLEMENLIYSVYPLSWDEIVHAKPGVLLKDYEASLTNLNDIIAEIIASENDKWDKKKIERKLEYEESNLDPDIQKSIGRFLEEIKKIDLEFYHEIIEDTVESSGAKNYTHKKKVFEKVLLNLSEKDKKNICKYFIGEV